MEITSREIATIIPALECWKEELAEGGEWVTESRYFQNERPLSTEEVDELMDRLQEAIGLSLPRSVGNNQRCKLQIRVPTYIGAQRDKGIKPLESPDFGGPDVPVLVSSAAGVRLVLGTHDDEDHSSPDVQIERRPHGWAIFLHPDAGDPVGCIFILDNGRTFLLPERFISHPIEIVDDIPAELDAP